MSRRVLALVAAAVVVIGGSVALLARSGTDGASASFCSLYPRIGELAPMLERGLEGRAQPDDLPVSNFRDLRVLVWSDVVAEGGPDETDAPARSIASSVRTAATEGDAAPLQTQEFRGAVAEVGPAAIEACEDVDL